jgi:hypothetical protein
MRRYCCGTHMPAAIKKTATYLILSVVAVTAITYPTSHDEFFFEDQGYSMGTAYQ